MTIAMESMAEYERRQRREKRMRKVTEAIPLVVSHLLLFMAGGMVVLAWHLGQPSPKPDTVIKKEVREVEVIRCDKAAIQSCLRRKG